MALEDAKIPVADAAGLRSIVAVGTTNGESREVEIQVEGVATTVDGGGPGRLGSPLGGAVVATLGRTVGGTVGGALPGPLGDRLVRRRRGLGRGGRGARLGRRLAADVDLLVGQLTGVEAGQMWRSLMKGAKDFTISHSIRGFEGDSSSTKLIRIDPATGNRVGGAGVELQAAGSLDVGAGAIWVFGNGRITLVDPSTGKPAGSGTAVSIESESGIAVGDDAAWVTQPNEGTLTRVGF